MFLGEKKANRKRKKILLCISCCLILCSCSGITNKDVRLDESITPTTTAVTTATIVPAAVSSSAIQMEKSDKDEKEIPKKRRSTKIVTDETGAKRKLEMYDGNTNDAGVYFSKSDWITNYSQVLDGHYYYLRHDDENGKYVIYCDQGKRVGDFEMPYEIDGGGEEYVIEGFAKYEKEFYLIMSHFSYDEEAENGNIEELALLDLNQGKPVVIDNITKDHLPDDEKIVFCNIYKNAFYFDTRTVWQMYDMRPGTSIRYDLKQEKIREKLSITFNMTRAKPYLIYIDDAVYYGVVSGKSVTLYCYDMRTEEESKIFCYKRKSKYKSEEVSISMDLDYIYCQDYLIPRSGGQMVRAFKDAKKLKNGMICYSSNNKYIFYIGKDEKVHRIDKKTKQDRVISGRRAVGVDCTKNHVYIRERDKVWYSKSFWEEYKEDMIDRSHYSDHLYCMDLDGKNEKRLWKGGYSDTR